MNNIIKVPLKKQQLIRVLWSVWYVLTPVPLLNVAVPFGAFYLGYHTIPGYLAFFFPGTFKQSFTKLQLEFFGADYKHILGMTVAFIVLSYVFWVISLIVVRSKMRQHIRNRSNGKSPWLVIIMGAIQLTIISLISGGFLVLAVANNAP